MYSGSFNDLLIELAGNRLFDEIWGIPPYEEHFRGTHISRELAENSLFRRMTDCEIVLRFFAFKNKERIKGAIRTILDKCMEDHRTIDAATRTKWRAEFLERLRLAKDIFGPDTFRIEDDDGRKILSQPLYDAVMVAVDRLYARRAELLQHKGQIATKLRQQLRHEKFYELVVGRPNTADAVKKRLDRVEKLFVKCL